MEDLKLQDSSDMQGKGGQLISLSSQAFEQLLGLGLDLNHLYLLENPDLQIDNPKLLGWKQTLIRKGYLDMQGVLTPGGVGILIALRSGTGSLAKPLRQKREKREDAISDFERWWDTYPPTDTFTYKGKTFRGTRALRKDRIECQIKFGAIISEGKYTGQELIDALMEEKKYRMEASLKDRKNMMSYMQGSTVYLNQRTFEAWIELSKQPKLESIELNDAMKRIDI